MMKKIKKYLLILCIVFPVLVYADDGSLKLDTDIITNSTQDTDQKIGIESKYAPKFIFKSYPEGCGPENSNNERTVTGGRTDYIYR